jgi:hypothetical protein
MSKPTPPVGIEKLRRMVQLFDGCNEDFNYSYTVEELVRLYDAYLSSGWEIYPDEWTRAQVHEALMGEAPKFCSECERDPRSCWHAESAAEDDYFGSLRDYKTGDYIRDATRLEQSASVAAAERDGGRGAFTVDGRVCYVED